MPTSFVKGDLFADADAAPPPRARAFGADISGEMNRGIAVAFAKRWPALAAALKEAGTKLQLGDSFRWKDGDDIVYALLVHSGDRKPKVATLARALDAMVAQATEDGVGRVALPNIGAGKGGIDKVRVKKVLTDAGIGTGVQLVVFEQFVRSKPEPV